MSDKPEQKKGWFQRLTSGLTRSSQAMTEQVTGAFTKRPLDQEQLDALEEMLIEADLGPQIAARITEAFGKSRFGKSSTDDEVKEALAELIAAELSDRQGDFDPLNGPRPYVVLFIGVNGSGKTTTLGKIAADLTEKGARVLIAAGDTFRAAAVEQLKVWADRAGADFMAKPTGSDAAALAYEAVERAKAEHYDVVLIDTAGRLQNKQGLMDELLKVIRVVKKVDPDYPHETLLVLDATVGRNALAQEKIFGNQVGVSGIVMTKLDGTARGGVLVPVARASDSPIKLIGVGEGGRRLRRDAGVRRDLFHHPGFPDRHMGPGRGFGRGSGDRLRRRAAAGASPVVLWRDGPGVRDPGPCLPQRRVPEGQGHHHQRRAGGFHDRGRPDWSCAAEGDHGRRHPYGRRRLADPDAALRRLFRVRGPGQRSGPQHPVDGTLGHLPLRADWPRGRVHVQPGAFHHEAHGQGRRAGRRGTP
jgi:fused signal recognition particle receptor